MNEMTAPVNGDPWWLPWIVPALAIIGALGGVLIWIGRVMLLPGFKKELEDLLADKFAAAERDIKERHAQNQAQFRHINLRLNDGANDRQQLREDLNEVKEDVAYLRGKSSGTFKHL
jgi:hypothetical protein